MSAASPHPRRELNVGWGTTQAIIANAFAPGTLDHYPGRIGFDQQQGDEPEEPGRRDNLYTPVAGDAGAHGVFSDQARSVSPALMIANTHRGAIGAAVAVVAVVALARLFARK